MQIINLKVTSVTMGKDGSLEGYDQRNVITRKEIYLKEIKCLLCLHMRQNTFIHPS